MTEASFRRGTRHQIELRWGVLSIKSDVLGSGAPTTCVCCGVPDQCQCPRGPLFKRVNSHGVRAVPDAPARHCGRFLCCSCGFEDQIQPLPSCELLKSERQLLFADEAPLRGVWTRTLWERPSTTSNLFRALRRLVTTLPEGQCATRFGMGRAETWERSSSQWPVDERNLQNRLHPKT